MLTQENLIAEASFIHAAHELTEDDTVLCVLPYFHINGLMVTLITPIYAGITIILPEKFSASKFWSWISEYRTSWFSAVTAIYSIIVDKLPPEFDLSSLKFARSASSALPIALLQAFEQKTGVPIIESLGISEGGSQITTNPRPPKTCKPGSVGLPFGNKIRVIDSIGNILPPLKSGEVIVQGANICKGYYNKPKETCASFIDGWFHTGDIGWIDQEGYLFLEGRIKELINRAGEKFSPKEVDEVLYQLPQIESAAAVGVPHKLYGEEIVAYVKLREGQRLPPEEIQAYCKGKLADFKVPKQIFFVDDFPKGPSGKIQRLKLTESYNSISEM
jgi:acyl-CoA synthetase (AMP-forming)/AMP-acid ligase II